MNKETSALTTYNNFNRLTLEQISEDLAESRRQIAEGKVKPAEEVMKEIGEKYGFRKAINRSVS